MDINEQVNHDAIEDMIIEVLNKIRGYLRRDGGDVEYVGFKDGVVYIHMLGACNGCAYIDNTVKGDIETILIEEVPGVLEVEAI